jgi:LuxR family quorum-sensing system transcriptional regulator CciR
LRVRAFGGDWADPGPKLWEFLEFCRAELDVEVLADRFLSEMAELGFPHVALASHVDPIHPPPGAVMVLRYPRDWVEHYSAEGLQNIDPVFMAACRRTEPFQWSEGRFLASLNAPQLRMLAEGREAGIADGVTIPIRGSDALPASCSLVPDMGGVDPENTKLAEAMAIFAHERLRQLYSASVVRETQRLTDRERQCLILVARGKSDWVISSLLGVSENAVNRTIERAKKRMGVATRTQAIVRALHAGEFTLYDITE